MRRLCFRRRKLRRSLLLLGLLLLFFREFLFRLIFLVAPKGFGMGRNVLPERRNALKA